MASHLPKLAEPIRTVFALLDTPLRLPVVYEPKPTPATTTLSPEAFWALRFLETEGERLSRNKISDAIFIRDMASYAGVGIALPLGVAALVATVAGGAAITTGASFDFGWVPLAAGAMWAAPMGGGLALARRASSKNAAAHASVLRERFAADLSTIEATMDCGSSLERAWLARWAETAYLAITKRDDSCEPQSVRRPGQGGGLSGRLERWFPGVEAQPFAMRVSAIADQFARASEEDRAQVEVMLSISDIVFAPGRRRYETPSVGPFTTQVQEISDKLEWIMHAIEELAPEARALLKTSIANMVTKSLELRPGNTWRIKRFHESFDAKYTPYANGELEIATTVKIEELGNGARRARVRIDSSKEAECLAAYLEQQGLRASIYESPNGFVVTGYDAKNPPSGNYCRGETEQ